MVRMDSFSSVPPHIQPPIAQVPSAILELTRFVPSMLMYSIIVCRYLPAYLELVVFLAKPPRVGVGAVEPMTCFIELELPRSRSLCCFCEKRGNLGRIHRLKTASSLKSLLKNRERVTARDNNTGGKIHSIVKALHRTGCLAFENNVVTHRLHTEHADVVLEQDRQNFLFKAIKVRVHYVERHLNGIEREAVF